jgi:hypothetical protein
VIPRAPSSAKRSAAERPMPESPPVTIAVRPLSLRAVRQHGERIEAGREVRRRRDGMG